MDSALQTPADSTASAPAAAEPTAQADAAAAIAGGRARIDELDGQIIDLVLARMAVSRTIQRARTATGGRRVDHGREVEIVNRYANALGPTGTELALAILTMAHNLDLVPTDPAE